MKGLVSLRLCLWLLFILAAAGLSACRPRVPDPFRPVNPPSPVAADPTAAAPQPANLPSATPAAAEPTIPPPQPTSALPAGKTPLKDAVALMAPRQVWQNFYDLTQIPRPSKHEEKVRDYLVQFGKGLGLETQVDEVGNVIIRKPAAQGLQNRKGVILQAHMDMVPQKTEDKEHDFLTDPIDAYVEDGWVKADRTTLGADDGSGVAIAMAFLQLQDPLGPIETLFTVNEENGMDGALGLKPGLLHGDILINLDSEKWGEFTIGSAGGEIATITSTYTETASPAEAAAYQVTVSGLVGGHSGVDINLGRGNAIKLLVRLLTGMANDYEGRVASFAGGTAMNAIPREAAALVVVPKARADGFLQFVQQFAAAVKNELAAVEPNLDIQAAPADLPATVMEAQAQRTLLNALYANPSGVLRMSDTVPGLVETSTNLGIANLAGGKLEAVCYPRSSVDSELDDLHQMLVSVWDLAGIPVVFNGRFPGWTANPNSPILGLTKEVYKEQTGQEASVVALHAGLECGTIRAVYPNLDAISIGPTLLDVHTPNERIEVVSVQQLYDLLLETLNRIPSQGQ